MFRTLVNFSWLETTTLLAKQRNEIDEPCHVVVRLGRLENQESEITMAAGIGTVTGIGTGKLS